MTNFNEVTLHHNFEVESFFAASGELVVPAGGHSSPDNSKALVFNNHAVTLT